MEIYLDLELCLIMAIVFWTKFPNQKLAKYDLLPHIV